MKAQVGLLVILASDNDFKAEEIDQLTSQDDSNTGSRPSTHIADVSTFCRPTNDQADNDAWF